MVSILHFGSEIGIFLRHLKNNCQSVNLGKRVTVIGGPSRQASSNCGLLYVSGNLLTYNFPKTTICPGYTPRSLYSFSYAFVTELVKLLITKCKLNVNIKRLAVDNVIVVSTNMSNFTT